MGLIRVHYFNYLNQVTKNPIALRLGRQEFKNYLLLHSSFTFIIESSVFPIQYLDVCAKTKQLKKKKKIRANLYKGQMQQAQCVQLAWRKRPRNTSRTELQARLEIWFAWAKIIFQCFFC